MWINTDHVLGPSAPFGGFKQSGWGREHSAAVFDAYTEQKTVILNKGVLVIQIAKNEAKHIVSARKLVERRSVATAVASIRARAELSTTFGSNVIRQRGIAETGDMSEFSAADADLRGAIVHAVSYSLLEQFYLGLHERQRRMATDSSARDPGQVSGIVEDHSRLIGLIESSDVNGFELAVDRDMRRVHGWNLGTSL
ncbi:hypothetical protein CJ178_30710 [Rhodococcus sp. ACPA4]|nr:hypothetical protein CJ178_30710 [Rhodococcus sp. ACPA4]RZL20899.1 MAG: aldehyde dehydrogenase family protein [Rhodococcus sp. (in: high G+C Gram-positive bacteria)]